MHADLVDVTTPEGILLADRISNTRYRRWWLTARLAALSAGLRPTSQLDLFLWGGHGHEYSV